MSTYPQAIKWIVSNIKTDEFPRKILKLMPTVRMTAAMFKRKPGQVVDDIRKHTKGDK